MSMENIAGARKPAKREDEHTVAGEHRMMRRADREVTNPEQIAAISSFSTLLPGDVIMTGTPNASGHLDPGDETIVHVEGIGDLRNVIVRA